MKRDREESKDESDVDEEFLDNILNQLYDFGDGVKGKQSKKKSKKMKKETNEEEDTEDDVEDSNNNSKNIDDTAEWTKNHGVNDEEKTKSSSTASASSTKLSKVEVVTFVDPLKKNRLKRTDKAGAKPPEVKDKKKNQPDDAISIEKARLEVHQFGITGFQKQQQIIFEQERAIMLGARPPKKEYMNYKTYQQMIKEKKLKEKEEVKPDAQGKKKKSRKSGKQKTEKRKVSSSGGELTGRVGRFKNGMLVLSNKVIQKLNVKVRK